MISRADRIRFLAREPMVAVRTAIGISVIILVVVSFRTDEFSWYLLFKLFPVLFLPFFLTVLWSLRKKMRLKLDVLREIESENRESSISDLEARFVRVVDDSN